MNTRLLENATAQSAMSTYSKLVPPLDGLKDLGQQQSESMAVIGIQSKMQEKPSSHILNGKQSQITDDNPLNSARDRDS